MHAARAAADDRMAFSPARIKPPVTMVDVDKLDVRIGTILDVADVAASDKLLRLIVDFGDHRRTILAGMKKERSDPQEIVGRQALFIVNLEPRRMAGEVSEGMLFDIGYADHILPALAVPERAVPNGVRAG
jgi:tRNA-binding protein